MSVDKKKTLDFTTKGPVPVYCEDDKADQRAGCSILDVSFSEPVTIGEVHFRNHYTSSMTISCKRVPLDKDVRNRDVLPWQVSIKQMMLMTDPHCEQGSQDLVMIPSKSSLIPWSGVVTVRIILRQPSAHWKKFGIEDLAFHKEILKDPKTVTYIPRMFAPDKTELSTLIHETASKDGGSSTSDTGAVLQSMKLITETMKNVHTKTAVGRFEVDGSYDVSHLI